MYRYVSCCLTVLVTVFGLFLSSFFGAVPLYCQTIDLQEKAEHKKFLFVVPWLIVGGADRVTVALINNLDIPPEEIDVCVVLDPGGALEQAVRKGVRFITKEQAFHVQYDVAAYNSFFLDPLLWKNIQAKKKIQWIHTDLAACNLKLPAISKSDCALDYFVCVSQKAKEGFAKMYPHLASKAILMYNIIDSAAIRKEAEAFVSDMPEKSDELRVVTVGRLAHEKGIDRAIEVHRRLKREGYSFQWYVVGEGDERAKYERMISSYGLKGQFILLGEKINPYPYIKRADIFALFSRYEGFALVVSEAKSVSRPIIVTDFTGAKEQLISEENGLIVDNNDEAIYQGMKRILSDAAMRKRFSKKLENFEYDNGKTLEEIHKILQCN